MAQVYGCIECGMLFAGWEFCLAHMEEQCRPTQYLESHHDHENVKELCMIGHPNCRVPTYKPLTLESNNDSLTTGQSMDSMENSSTSNSSSSSSPVQIHSYDSEKTEVNREHEGNHQKDQSDKNQEDQNHLGDNNAPDLENFFSESSSSDEESACETMLTEDYLNPVGDRKNLRHVAAEVDWEQQHNRQTQPKNEQPQQQQRSQLTRKKLLTPEEEQEEMVMDLFSPEEKESILLAMQKNISKSSNQNIKNDKSHPTRPVLIHQTNCTIDGKNTVTNSQSPAHQQVQGNRYSAQLKAAEKTKRRLQIVERCLLELIQEAAPIAADQPNMVMLDMLPKVYQLQFGTHLDHQAMGFVSLKALLRAIPSVAIVKKSPYFGIEHEYLQCSATSNINSLLSWNEDESSEDDTAEENSNNKIEPEDEESFSDQKTPQHTNHQQSRFSFNLLPNDSISSKHGLSIDLEPMSALPTLTSKASDTKEKKDELASSESTQSNALSPTCVGDDDEASNSSSTVSSYGSSKSIINALTEMLPSTHAFNDISRVMSKYPGGVTIGQLFQQAPELKNFLSHCTDRRCEAQIKLAHTMLQQCHYFKHKRTADRKILYFLRSATGMPATRPLSVTTKRSLPPAAKTISTESSMQSMSLSMSGGENTEKNSSYSEKTAPTGSDLSPFATPRSSNDAPSENSNPPASPFKFHRPPRLETISRTTQRTPTGSRSSSPQAVRTRVLSQHSLLAWSNTPCTPPRSRVSTPPSAMSSPSSTPARDLAIAESAARILAEAQLMTTPRSSIDKSTTGLSPIPNAIPSPKPFTLTDEAMKAIEQYTQEERSLLTAQSSNSARMTYRSSSPMYFFTDEMDKTPGDEANYGNLGHAASSITAGSAIGPESECQFTATSPKDKAAEREGNEVESHRPESPGSTKEDLRGKSLSREEIIEKLALDLFPSTSMHYELLVALAEHSHGMTWHEVITCIPGLTSFVNKFATENGIQGVHAATVLQSCPSIRSKKTQGSDLYYINAPKALSSMGSKDTVDLQDAASVSSGMTESSTLSSSLSHLEQLKLELLFEGSDISATVSFLGMLKIYFLNRPWPSTKLQLKHFLARIIAMKSASSDMLSFRAWLHKCAGDTALSLSRKANRAAATLMSHLLRLGCVRCQGIDLSWNMNAVDCILDNTAAIWKSSDLECDRNNVPVAYISTMHQLENAVETAFFLTGDSNTKNTAPVCVSCIGAQDELHLILIGNELGTYIFDCVKLSAQAVCTALTSFFTDESALKIFHDVHWAASAVSNLGRLHQPLRGVFDMQLAMEWLMGESLMSLESVACQFGIAFDQKHSLESFYFGERPLTEKLMASALDHFDLVCKVQSAMKLIFQRNVHSKQIKKSIQAASDMRATWGMETYGKRRMCHDIANRHDLVSLELLETQRPTDIAVAGASRIILDILEVDPTKSILVLGEKSSGKTTVLQDAALILAENTTVSILDRGKENSVSCKTRHLVVGKDEKQADVMLQCARLHAPSVMVVDELETTSDVESAFMCKRRSVRLLASTMAGSLRELVEDPFLSGLIRGVGSVHTGTAAPTPTPIFEVVVELRRGVPNEFRVITDTAEAVDAIVQGTSYPVQVRTLDPVSGGIQVQFEQV